MNDFDSNNLLLDPTGTNNAGNIGIRGELRNASSLSALGATFVGSSLDANMWTSTLSGSGSQTVGSGAEVLATGSTANSSSVLNSNSRSKFVAGSINAFYGSVKLGDTGVANNVRRWGAYDSSDGVYFEITGTTQGVGVRSSGSDTVVTSLNGPNPFVIDTNFHYYEIQYNTGVAFFYQDGKLVHTYASSASSLSSTPHYKLGFETTNSGGGTSNAILTIREASVMRYGSEYSRPRYFHPVYSARVQSATAVTTVLSTSVTATISPTTAGNTIIVAACCNAGTLTVSDSASQSYSTATTIAGNGTQTSKIFYFPDTAAGVTTVTISSTSSTDLNLVVTEYAGILAASPLDQTSTHGQTASTSWTSNATASIAQVPELLVGTCMCTLHNNSVFTAGTGWSSVATVLNTRGGANLELFMEDQNGTSLTTYAATGTVNQSDDEYAAIATFRFALPSSVVAVGAATKITHSAGTLKRVVLNSVGTGSASATFYDSTTNSGTIIAALSLTSAVGPVDYDLDFSNGLTMVVNSSTADFTVVYD